MEPLSTLRTRFHGNAREIAPSPGGVFERVASLEELSLSFAATLDETEWCFREEHREHLTRLQARLRRLDEKP